MKYLKIQEDYKKQIKEISTQASVAVAKRIIELWPELLKVQPCITGFTSDYSTWNFTGEIIIGDTQQSTLTDSSPMDYDEVIEFMFSKISSVMPDDEIFRFNDSMLEIICLLNFVEEENLWMPDLDGLVFDLTKEDNEQIYQAFLNAGIKVKS